MNVAEIRRGEIHWSLDSACDLNLEFQPRNRISLLKTLAETYSNGDAERFWLMV